MQDIVKQGYEKGDYEKTFRQNKQPNTFEKGRLDAFLQELPKNAKVLDLGCGIGIPFDKYLVDRGIKVKGIDISKKHVEMARKNVSETEFIEGDFSEINFDEKSYDGILALYSIFHIHRDQHKNLLEKVYKTLKDSGVTMITFGTSGSEYGEEDNFCGSKMAWSTFEPETYKQFFQEIGFKVIEEKYEGNPGDEEYHYWALVRK